MSAVTITRTLPASRDRVWRAFTDPIEYARWFWPPRFAATYAIDPVVGGRWRVASGPTGMAVGGGFTSVVGAERLAYTWRWDGEKIETRVTIEFADAGDGATTLRLEHDGFPDDDEARSHEQGWRDCLDRLPAALADPPADPAPSSESSP